LSKPVQFTPVARSEVAAASRWYEDKREGLGDEFLERVDEAVRQVEQSPEGFAVVFEGLRRINLAQFPYSLFYKVLPDNSLIVACLHGKRSERVARERGRGILPMARPE
jgi:toxin ParE1/3/4